MQFVYFIFNSQWTLVCGRRLLAPMVNTFYFSGVTLGAFICGILSDKFGRKTMLVICLFSQGTLGILLRFSHFLPIFTIMRMMQGFFVQVIHFNLRFGLLFAEN